MYDFKIEAADKATLYRDLASALEGLVAGEPDAVANMANAAALIWETLPDVNWVGFYRNIDGELVLGPFQGRPACIRMTFGTGRVRRGGRRPGRCSGSRMSTPSPATSPATALEQRDRGAARSATASCSRVLDIDSPTTCAVRAKRTRRAAVRLAEILARSALAQLLQLLVAQRARDDHHRAGQLAGIVAGKIGDQRPRIAGRRRAEHQRGNVFARADIGADGRHRIALLDDDFGVMPGRVHDLADRGATTPSMRRRCSSSIAAWTPPHWTKSCGSTIAEHFDRPSVLAARRAAKRSATRASALSSITTR